MQEIAEGSLLTLIWVGIVGFAVFMYVLMDGFDLGIGILYPFAPTEEDRDTMMNTVAPVWDFNETWLVLGGAGLFGAFPLAYATLLPAFYLPLLVMLIALVFRGVNGDLWVEHLLTSLPGGPIGFLIVVNLLFFTLAFFLDFFELAFILVPLVGPVAHKLGIDLVWFGVLLGVNMQTSFMHPPFGFALFYLRSVASRAVKTSEIYWGAIPFVLIQVVMVGLIIAFPQLVMVEKTTTSTDNPGLRMELPVDPYAPSDWATDAPQGPLQFSPETEREAEQASSRGTGK